MPNINYTFNDSSGRPEPVEPGVHRVKCVGYEFGLTGNGNDKLDLIIQIKDGPKIYDTITFTEKALWKMDVVLKCFAPSKKLQVPAKGQDISVNEAFVEKFIEGGTCEADIILDVWEKPDGTKGMPKNKIGNFKIPTTQTSARIEPEPVEDDDPF